MAFFNKTFMAKTDELDGSFSKKFENNEISHVSNISAKLKQRAGKRQSLTKTIESYRSRLLLLSKNDAKFCLNKLDELHRILTELDGEIEHFMLGNELWKSDEYLSHASHSEAYLDKLSLFRIELQSHLDSGIVPSTSSSSANANNDSNRSVGSSCSPNIKLPTVELPKFDGTPENYDQFISSFESIISQCNLSVYEKYSYLLQSVSGNAKQIVESMPVGNLNYDAAKKLLSDAFSSVICQQYSVIEKLLNLKLNGNKNFYTWVSEARVLSEQATRLKIDCDVFVQYFLWRGLPDSFKQGFIWQINKSKPSLREIIDNAFEVYNRLPNNVGDHFTKSVTLSTGASSYETGRGDSGNNARPWGDTVFDDSNYSYSNKSCSLCSKDGDGRASSHTIFNCVRYESPEAKLDKLKAIGGCTRCGYPSHISRDCNYKFRNKCIKCNAYHAHFLCNVNSDKKSANKMTKASTNTVEFNVMQTSTGLSEVVIPSFTTKILGKRGKKLIDNRVMYDPASQISFITKSAVSKVNYTVVQSNFGINISGFNQSRQLVTDIVQIETNIGGKGKTFTAAVVPEIKAKIVSSDFIEIKKIFSKEKINLADKHLGDDGGVDVLLGVDNAHILPIHSCSFGASDKLSLLYYSAAGIMLSGNMSNLVGNSVHLNLVKAFIDKINNNK